MAAIRRGPRVQKETTTPPPERPQTFLLSPRGEPPERNVRTHAGLVGSLERRRREKILPPCPPPAIVQPAAGDEKICPKNVKIYDFCSAAPAVSDEPQGSILRLLGWQKDVDSNMLEPSEVTTGGDPNTPSVPRKERSGSTHAWNEWRLEFRESPATPHESG